MFVCGVEIGEARPQAVHASYDASTGDQLVASYDLLVGSQYKSDFALTCDGSLMAIAFANRRDISIYQMQPTFQLIRRFGRRTTKAGPHAAPID